MPLAPLRPRRRRIIFDSAATSAPPPRAANLAAVADRLAGLIDGPVSEAVVVMLTELYGDALARILAAIEAAPDGQLILERICADDLTGGLLVVHDLHPHPPALRIERALSVVAPKLAPPMSVRLDRIEDDTVHLGVDRAIGTHERAVIARAIAQRAPEISHICIEVLSASGCA